MLLLVIITITHIRTSQCVKAIPKHPVPHAEILDDLLSKFLGGSYSNNSVFDFILGEPNQNKDAKITAGDNLDISVLDVDSVRKIINFAKKKYENEIPAIENSRRRNRYYKFNFGDDRIFFLMKQSIYMTQEKINSTRTIRNKYGNKPDYQIALLYGAAAATLGKMENLIAQQRHLNKTTHFIWYLILYEKILACNIDIDDSVEKLFQIHARTAHKGP